MTEEFGVYTLDVFRMRKIRFFEDKVKETGTTMGSLSLGGRAVSALIKLVRAPDPACAGLMIFMQIGSMFWHKRIAAWSYRVSKLPAAKLS